MIYYYIPDFIGHYSVNQKLLELMQQLPEIFYDDFKIGAVFGNFPNCIWNGGGHFNGNYMDKGQMEYYSSMFNMYGVPLRLTMTNPLIEEKHTYDSYANFIMKNLNNGFNQVLVSNPILEEHIRKNYPEYPVVRSILAAKDVYYDDSDKYFMSVLRKHKNDDLEFLQNIERKEKIEILANETCEENCPRAYTHYLEYAKMTLHQDYNEDLIPCSYNRNFKMKKFYESPLCLTYEKIKKVYEPMGFKHFKISGRGTHGGVVLYYAHYMVKPEYKEDFISLMMESICADNR